MSLLSLISLGASVAFQYMEMTTYGLDKEIIKKITGGDSAPAATTAPVTTSAEKTKAE